MLVRLIRGYSELVVEMPVMPRIEEVIIKNGKMYRVTAIHYDLDTRTQSVADVFLDELADITKRGKDLNA